MPIEMKGCVKVLKLLKAVSKYSLEMKTEVSTKRRNIAIAREIRTNIAIAIATEIYDKQQVQVTVTLL